MEALKDINSLKQELKGLIISAANLSLKPEEIADSSPLFREGLALDSIDLLEIVVQLDKKYQFKIRNDEQGRKSLASVQTLAEALWASKKSN